MYHISLALQCSDGENGDGEERSEISREGKRVRLPVFLYADNLVLYGKSEEDLRAMVEHFIEDCRAYRKIVTAFSVSNFS